MDLLQKCDLIYVGLYICIHIPSTGLDGATSYIQHFDYAVQWCSSKHVCLNQDTIFKGTFFCAGHLPVRLDIETKFPYFLFLTWLSIIKNQIILLNINITRLHKSRSSRSELEFDLSNFV